MHKKQEMDDLKATDRYGIRWVRTRPDWGLEPRWITEPKMSAVLKAVKDTIDLESPPTIKLHAEGVFNKLYSVKSREREVIARITLPIEPRLKTLSEVATLQWVRDNTKLSVPRVLAYNAARTYSVGYEWIIMEKASGRTLGDAWPDTSYDSKEKLVRQIAAFFSDTFCHQRRGIGNLMPSDTDWVILENPLERMIHEDSGKDRQLSQKEMTVERLVHTDFYGYEASQEVSRGPFATSRQWISARLDMTEHDCKRRLGLLRQAEETAPKSGEGDSGEDNIDKAPDSSSSSGNSTIEPDDDDDEEDLLETLDIILRLRGHMENFFPPEDAEEPEPTIIFHKDMSNENILIDEHGDLSAVVDWEFVSAIPRYAACQFPSFLESYTVNKKPIRSEYEDDGEIGPDSLYSEHLQFWELTQLRKLFLEEMGKLRPAWIEIFNQSTRQRDFHMAVGICDDYFSRHRVRHWLDELDSGEKDITSLEDKFDDLGLDM